MWVRDISCMRQVRRTEAAVHKGVGRAPSLAAPCLPLPSCFRYLMPRGRGRGRAARNADFWESLVTIPITESGLDLSFIACKRRSTWNLNYRDLAEVDRARRWFSDTSVRRRDHSILLFCLSFHRDSFNGSFFSFLTNWFEFRTGVDLVGKYQLHSGRTIWLWFSFITVSSQIYVP